MIRLTIDQLAELLSPSIHAPEFRPPECAVKYCSKESSCHYQTSSGSVFLCPEHERELQKKINRLRRNRDNQVTKGHGQE